MMGVLEFQNAEIGIRVRHGYSNMRGFIAGFGYLQKVFDNTPGIRQAVEVDCVDKANGAYVKYDHVKKPQFVPYNWLSFDL